MTLCDSLYPRKLAIHYLQDLQREFSKFDDALLNSLVKPYSYPKFGNLSQPSSSMPARPRAKIKEYMSYSRSCPYFTFF